MFILTSSGKNYNIPYFNNKGTTKSDCRQKPEESLISNTTTAKDKNLNFNFFQLSNVA